MFVNCANFNMACDKVYLNHFYLFCFKLSLKSGAMFVAVFSIIVEVSYIIQTILHSMNSPNGREVVSGCLFIALQIFMITVDILLVRGIRSDSISWVKLWIYFEISVTAVDLLFDIGYFIYTLKLYVILIAIVDFIFRVYFIVVVRSFARYLRLGDEGTFSYVSQEEEPTQDEPTHESDNC